MSFEHVVAARMNGAGNTFAIVDERMSPGIAYADLARRLCAADDGTTLDGVLVLASGVEARWRMRVFNADGGEAEMCGNGIRCVVRYLFENGETDGHCTIETLAGSIACEVTTTQPAFAVRANIGAVRFPAEVRDESLEDAPAVRFVRVDLGNPHAVVWCDDVERVDLAALAARFAMDERFTGGTNVHVAQVVNRSRLRVRHFERGVGGTAACGTGAVAVAAVAIARGFAVTPVDVDVPGGRLRVAWSPGADAYLSGPAEWEPSALAVP